MKFIYPLLAKIEVTEVLKDFHKYIREGTTGFISDIMSFGAYFNSIQHEMILTKVGKGGKDRFETIEFHIDLIPMDSFSEKELSALKGTNGREYGLYSPNISGVCKITYIDIGRNISEMSTKDFLGFITAFSRLLQKVSGITGPLFNLETGVQRKFNRALIRPDGIFTAIISRIHPTDISTYILNAYKYDTKLKTEDHIGVFEEYFSSVENRKIVMDRMYQEVAYLSRGFKMLANAMNYKKEAVSERMNALFKKYV